MPPEARLYEPALALDGGEDGLDVHRRIAAGATEWLVPGGHLLIEVSEAQLPPATQMLLSADLAPRAETSADLDATVLIGRRTI
jgi:release factor glutamine methyltransferase